MEVIHIQITSKARVVTMLEVFGQHLLGEFEFVYYNECISFFIPPYNIIYWLVTNDIVSPCQKQRNNFYFIISSIGFQFLWNRMNLFLLVVGIVLILPTFIITLLIIVVRHHVCLLLIRALILIHKLTIVAHTATVHVLIIIHNTGQSSVQIWFKYLIIMNK